MSKAPSLAEAVKDSAASKPARPEKPAPEVTEEPRTVAYQPPSRRGKKAITVHYDPAVIKQLKVMGMDLERSTQDMITEAINDFFVKHSKPPLAS